MTALVSEAFRERGLAQINETICTKYQMLRQQAGSYRDAVAAVL